MDKKICVITGANSGIGKAAAVQIAKEGYFVVMACRSQEKGEAALAEVQELSGSADVVLMVVDMSLQSSIKAFAEAYKKQYKRLDVLIQNAAVFDISQKTAVNTDEGIESVWATNHVGPVLLTELLWDALRSSQGGRVITIASKGLLVKPFLKVNLDDPEYKNRKFSVENAYYQSKLAQIMYTYWLAKRGKPERITANCIRVPAVKVDIEKFGDISPLMKKAYEMKSKSSLSPGEMAMAYSALAVSREMKEETGKYFDDKLREVESGKYSKTDENIEKVMDLTLSYML